MIYGGTKMKINKLGPIASGTLKFNDFMVIWGKNNSGKTMLTYLLYAIQEEFRKFTFDFSNFFYDGKKLYEIVNDRNELIISKSDIKELYNQFQTYFESNAQEILSTYFAVKKDFFDGFSIKFDENELYVAIPMKRKKSRGFQRRIVNGMVMTNTFSLQERGDSLYLSLLQQSSDQDFDDDIENEGMKPLDFNVDTLNTFLSGFLKHMTNRSRNMYFPAERIGINQFRSELKSSRATKDDDFTLDKDNDDEKRYPLPVESYIEMIFNVNYQKSTEEFRDKWNALMGGEFSYDDSRDEYEFISNKTEVKVPFNIISSSLKSLFGIEEYLTRSRFVGYSSIIIDEPEMNLHPQKQVEIMDFFAMLVVEKKFPMVISTHSSYITRKLLNILLKNKKKTSKGLTVDNVNIYEIRDGEILSIDLIKDQEFIQNFDSISLLLDEEYYSLIDD